MFFCQIVQDKKESFYNYGWTKGLVSLSNEFVNNWNNIYGITKSLITIISPVQSIRDALPGVIKIWKSGILGRLLDR